LQDRTLVANERRYPYYDNLALFAASRTYYFLSDDYYAASLPFGVTGRELYMPQYGLGRLVESPLEIATMIDTFLGTPVLSPDNALVTGYDFLIDQAQTINSTLADQGLPQIDTLIDNEWTGEDFRQAAFSAADYDLISLNSHFDHFRFFPNDPDNVLATEFDNSNFEGKLIFSVGCHAGLNMPDGGTTLSFTGADYAQVFAQHGTTYVGNTGFGLAPCVHFAGFEPLRRPCAALARFGATSPNFRTRCAYAASASSMAASSKSGQNVGVE
jgi:hypothetical protein